VENGGSVQRGGVKKCPVLHRFLRANWKGVEIYGTMRGGWTSDLAAAWTDAYSLLSEYMIDEAYGRREAAE
jgi:hypothetical protein